MKTIILCGGSGTRLWPLSRTLYPKQFYPLFEGHSLFQRTVSRNAAHSTEFVIVVNQEQYFMAEDQYKDLKLSIPARFILEPEGRNTAPAIALAALALKPHDTMLVVPSDHLIQNLKAYETAIKRAQELATQNQLITFGIKPAHAETGFGYIEANGETVMSFKEKPDAKTAQEYLSSGKYFWNSGMFCFKAETFLDSLAQFDKPIFETSKLAWESAKENSPHRVDAKLMKAIPSNSIDYSVMEKARETKVIPVDMGWSDLGSFDALYESLPHDQNQNTLNPNSILTNSHRNLVVSDKRLVATIDVDDLVIVDTPDALLISKRGSTQKVKDIVGTLKEKKSELTNIHTTAHRPWGSYTILEEANLFKVKRIVVKPGARLSLQKHAHRSEHWIVVQGKAYVTVGEKTFPLERNQSTYISIGEVHRLENKESEDLILIEAQVGDYLGEDDIVRLVDDYKRV
ncbi:MAG: mannose-1-phosphate guanylyltransferase/mannose-6-phosphate isomerase [Bacteriovoracaceae bacterium]|nr:mannose-1-phosphate guanylyltransferase/mannose-6-phosphate isomerase [Bacteriovoracaceae bacterium]